MQVISFVPKKGDTGGVIVDLQNRLKELGYNPGTVDGIFGGKTAQAISALQKANGLPGSGVIGPKTLAILGFQVVPINPVTGREPITKELKGRKARHIHPTLRLMMEAKIFPNGVIPDAFVKNDVQRMVVLVSIGLESLKVREVGGNNRGKLVGLIQDIIGSFVETGTGDAWCMSTVQVIIAFIEDFLGVESPVLDSEGVTATAEHAKKIPGLYTVDPETGTFFQVQYGTKWQGHTGSVLELLAGGKMRTFEGNTGSDSIRDGSGAYFRTRDQKKFGSNIFVRGFIRVYPFNRVPTNLVQMAVERA